MAATCVLLQLPKPIGSQLGGIKQHAVGRAHPTSSSCKRSSGVWAEVQPSTDHQSNIELPQGLHNISCAGCAPSVLQQCVPAGMDAALLSAQVGRRLPADLQHWLVGVLLLLLLLML